MEVSSAEHADSNEKDLKPEGPKLQEKRVQPRETDALDDEATELQKRSSAWCFLRESSKTYIGDAAVRNCSSDLHENEDPAQGIKEAAKGLLRLELVVLDAGLVFSNAGNSLGAILGLQKDGGHLRVWEVEEHEHAPQHVNAPHNEKASLPALANQ